MAMLVCPRPRRLIRGRGLVPFLAGPVSQASKDLKATGGLLFPPSLRSYTACAPFT
jgi:hypothetical protein